MIFKEAPADFKKEIDVVGCYVQYGGEFILLERMPHKTNGGKLGLPAGKVDPGETIHQAMRREMREETGIDIAEADLRYFASVFVRHAGRDLHYHMFSVTLVEAPVVTLSPDEHSSFLWTTPTASLDLDLIHDLDTCTKLFYKL